MRHLSLKGRIAERVNTLSAILAGTSFATDLLYAVMLGPCDRLMGIWPKLGLSLVVDDLGINVVGNPCTLR